MCTNSHLYTQTPSSPTNDKLNGQTTPLDVSGLSQNEIQGLLLGSHPSSSTSSSTTTTSTVVSQSAGATVVGGTVVVADHQQQHQQHHHNQQQQHQQQQQHHHQQQQHQGQQTISIKREPEDLRKDPNGRSQKVIKFFVAFSRVALNLLFVVNNLTNRALYISNTFYNLVSASEIVIEIFVIAIIYD